MEKNNEVMNTENEEIEEVKLIEVSKAERFKMKAKAGLKKYGKKVATIVAIGTVGLVGYAIGKKSEDKDSYEFDDDIVDGDYTELTEVSDTTDEK